MVRIALLSIAFLVFVAIAVTLLVTFLVVAALALMIAVPLYLMAKPHLRKRGITKSPVEKLQDMYAEGKIDLFEFERRVASLVKVEHF